MIFQYTWQAVLEGRKTQTRRLVKPGETMNRVASGTPLEFMGIHERVGTIHAIRYGDYPGRLKYRVGQALAVQPGRGKPAIWTDERGADIRPDMVTRYQEMYSDIKEAKRMLQADRYHEARIRLTGIRQENVQDITEADAIAEGIELPVHVKSNGSLADEISFGISVGSRRDTYAELWDTIHTKPGMRWESNPLVWVLEFELVKEAQS